MHTLLQDIESILKEKSRFIDVLMIRSLNENVDDLLIQELLEYQNDDGGFGHGLEADIQAPTSSIAATNIAVSILDMIQDKSLIGPIIKDIVKYFISSYDEGKKRFPIAPKEVQNYPHAVWWDGDIMDNFKYGNPDPEVIGFLYKNKEYVEGFDLDDHVKRLIGFIQSNAFLESSMHTVLSVAHAYDCFDKDLQDQIFSFIQSKCRFEFDKLTNYKDYGLEPYKVYLINPTLLNGLEDYLLPNLTYIAKLLESYDVGVNWSWGRDMEVFHEVKDDWLGLFYYGYLKALIQSGHYKL
jgi:hypothetical protein